MEKQLNNESDMTSTFRNRAYIMMFLIIPVALGLAGYINYTQTSLNPQPLGGIPLMGLLSFTIAWLLFGEVRTKIIEVELHDDYLTIAKFAGLSKCKKFYYSELEGFKTSILPSGIENYEYLYIIKNSKKIGKLSTQYHCNYFGLKEEIKTKLKDLGFERFSFISEIKESFT